MSAEGFEVVGFEEVHERLVEEGRRALESVDYTGSEPELERVAETLRDAGWSVEVVEPPGRGGPPVARVELRGGTVVYIAVYPPRCTVTIPLVLGVLERLLGRDEGGRYRVIVFYSRRGRLGLAAYLYLGFVIEEWGVGVLFINGEPGELVEVLRVLEERGRYVPPEDEAVPLEGGG
ncbi:hypothetical protein JCM10135_12300 [Stetteria hydrogenophila]